MDQSFIEVFTLLQKFRNIEPSFMCGLLLINLTENAVLKTHRITRFVNSAGTLSAEGTGYLYSLVRALLPNR